MSSLYFNDRNTTKNYTLPTVIFVTNHLYYKIYDYK